MLQLDETDLHPSLRDPALDAVTFLNEVMSRHPHAISFAPGAPHPALLHDIDPARHIDAFLHHLCRTRGLTPAAARHLLHSYGPSRGLINDLVADALRRDSGIDVPPEALVITVGAQEAMLLTLRALFAGPHNLLAVTDPCYVGILGAARLLGIGLVPVPDDGHGPGPDRLTAACRAARAQGRRLRALYLAPDHANPSGALLGRADRLRLLDVAEAEDLLLLEDSAYAFTTAPGSALPPLKALDAATGRVVHLGTFAKLCLPGARVGFAVADQPVRTRDGRRRLLADELAALKTMTTVNTPPLAQAVIGGMLLEHGSLAALGRDRAALYRRNLTLLLDALDRHLAPGGRPPPGVTWNRPTGGFFVRMRLPVPVDTALLETSAEQYGVLWTPMAPFYADRGADVSDRGADVSDGRRHELRLSCSYLEPEQIETGARRLAAFVHGISPRFRGR
uniref:Aminotransferase n=1 Tax=Streptomyces roseoverticillatus TaxID=66429 RepID=A0A0S3TVV2_9ACTN|nr:aminotransferase [Streptomyces roseoverticillatus]